ncbi:hypothetical protein KKI22_01965 [Patescibacteria group bacterium]|nr:hypothetical protein [Patescibacteria group bacterium]
MSKKTIKNKLNLEKTVMTKITTGAINMKPRWFFVLGSISMILGLVSASIGAIFLMNLIFFLLRQHGPMGEWRLQLMTENFPWWILLFAVGGIVSGIYLLKKYDFSYKKNFSLIAGVFVIALILAAFLINLTGINDLWSRQGSMRRFYQRYQPATTQDVSTKIYRGRMQNKPRGFTF